MMTRSFGLTAFALCLASIGAFAPSIPRCSRATKGSAMTVLKSSKSDRVEGSSIKKNVADADGGKRFAAAALASAYLMTGGLFAAEAAYAAPDVADFSGVSSTVTLAGRSSGGRAGGRASSARSSSSYSSSRPTHTVVERHTTVVQQAPSVIVAPPPVTYGYGYASPISTPGLGLGLTLGAIDAVGDAMRESRQENEIRDTRNQLAAERQKEFELEQRLRMVEMQQMAGR